MGALTDWLTSTKATAAIGDWITQKLAPKALGLLEPLEKPMMAVDQTFEKYVRDPIGAAALQSAYAARGEVLPVDKVSFSSGFLSSDDERAVKLGSLEVIGEAGAATQNISYGEAAQYALWNTALRPIRGAIGGTASALGGKTALEKTYDLLPLLNPDYDILDEKQRLEAQDSAFYQLITGLTDLGLEIFIGGKGIGAATRAIKIRSGIQRNFKKPEEVIRQLEDEAQFGLSEIQRQARVIDLDEIDNTFDLTNISAPNGITEDILQGIKVTDELQALKIPSIYNSAKPLELARLVSLARTPREVSDLLLADLGSTNALKRLGEIAPALEDAYVLSSKPLQLDLPLGLDEVAKTFDVISDVAQQQKYVNVLNDIIKRDPNGKLGQSYEAWYKAAESGTGKTTWAPSKFKFQEKINSGIAGWKVDRLIGERTGIDETVLGGGALRPFRLLTLKSLRLKPRNYLEWGTVRGPLDSLEELSAVILSNKLLRQNVKVDGVDNSTFRATQLKIWNEAIGEEPKKLALKQIEENVANRISKQIAQEMGVAQYLDPTEALRNVQRKRDDIIGEAKNTKTGFIAENVADAEPLAINETMKFKLANAMPMLDLNILEREIRAQYGASLSKKLGDTITDIPMMFDSFERAFSAAVLIRPGYIPKNSIFEPFMRILGTLHTVSLPRLFRKNVVEVDVVDDVTGQIVGKKLDILAPDTPGGLALREELSPAVTLANTTKPGSYIEADIALGRVVVDPNNPAQKGFYKDYYKTYAFRLNQFKQEPISRRILAGADNDTVAKYLLSDLDDRGALSDFYRIVAADLEKTGSFNGRLTADNLTYVKALEIAQRYRKEIFDYLPDRKLQQEVLNSPIKYDVKSAQKLSKGQTLPSLQVEVENLLTTGGQGAIRRGIQKGINVGFRGITKPETELFRIPFARYYGNMRVQQLVDGYQKQGIPITSQLWENTIRPVAQEYALKQVEQTFYAIRRMNNVQYYSRFLMAFPNAMFNSIKFWTRQGFNNPYNFALLEQLRTSPWAVGMVVDEDGNKISPEEARDGAKAAYLVLPFFNKPDSKFQPFLYKMNVDQVNFLVNGPSPNWLGQVSVNTLIQANPTLETSLKDFMGEKAYNRIIYGGIPRGVIPESQELKGKSAVDILSAFGLNIVESTFVPGSLTSAAELIRTVIDGKDLKFDASAVGGTLWSVHTAKRIDWELNNPDNPEPSLEESIKDTQKFMFWRFATRLLSPLGITQQPTTIFYRNEYDKLEEQYANNPELLADRPGVQPYQAAIQDFIGQYGNEAMRALVSSIKFTTGIAPEQETVRRLENYKWLEDFVGDAPATRLPIVGMVLNPVIPGEYSPAAAAYLRTQEIAGEALGLGRKTFAEREREALEKEGWREYDKIVKKRDAALAGRRYKSITAKLNNDIRQEYLAELNALMENNKAWEEAYGNSENTFPESVNLIRTALDNKDFMQDISRYEAEKSLWQTIEIWMAERDRIFPEWQTAKVNSEERKRLKAEYENLIFTLSQSNTYFSDFANRYLNGDPMADIREILMTAEGLG